VIVPSLWAIVLNELAKSAHKKGRLAASPRTHDSNTLSETFFLNT